MQDFYIEVLPLDSAFDIHQACTIGSYDIVDTGGSYIPNFFRYHGATEIRHCYGEGPAETATFILALKRNQLQSFHVSQKPVGRFFNAQPARHVAGRVVSSTTVQYGADICNFQNVHDKIRDLIGFFRQLPRFGIPDVILLEKTGKLLDLKHAGAAWGHDVFAIVLKQCVDQSPHGLLGLLLIAAIDKGLAAAGLFGTKKNVAAQFFQKLNGFDSHSWKHNISQASYKKRDFHLSSSRVGNAFPAIHKNILLQH
jgi:hypothetical protein